MKILRYGLAALLALAVICGPAHAAAIDPILVDKGTGSYALGTPTYVNAVVLAANTAQSFTVPTGPNGLKAHYVSFAATCDFYANYTTTATVPSSAVTNGTASELNPLLRQISATTISVISPNNCIITASYFM